MVVWSAAFYSEFQTKVLGPPCQGRANRLSFVRESTGTFNLTTHLAFSLFGIPQSLSFWLILLRTEWLFSHTHYFFLLSEQWLICLCCAGSFPFSQFFINKETDSQPKPSILLPLSYTYPQRGRLSKMVLRSTSPPSICQVLIHVVIQGAGMASVDPSQKRKSKAQLPLHTAKRYAGMYAHLSLWLWNATMLWEPLVHASQF